MSIHGSRVRVEVSKDRVSVRLEAGGPVELDIWGSVHTVGEQPTIAVR